MPLAGHAPLEAVTLCSLVAHRHSVRDSPVYFEVLSGVEHAQVGI